MDNKITVEPLEYSYVGSELELFAKAVTWKRYYSSLISPYLGEDVLEVGAGIGKTTEILAQEMRNSWLCLEPDGECANSIDRVVSGGRLPGFCSVQVGCIADLEQGQLFDSILYIDVLEHIDDDRTELALASKHLRPGGHLIVLSPAYQFLYSPFDRAIGHYRRYNRGMLKAIAPRELTEVSLIYIDAAGLLASLGNRVLLKQSMPTKKQIDFWDRVLIPISKKLDPLFQNTFGKSIIGIWQRR